MAEKPVNILLIEDNPGDARLIKEMLAEAGNGSFVLRRCDRLSSGLEQLTANGTDIVLLDLSLPDSQGLDTVTRVHSGAGRFPIVVLTGLDDETLAVRAVQHGAQDYLVKGHFDSRLLQHAIRYAIERHHLLVELEEARREQLELKDRFLSKVSHELRTPLAAIHQFVTILLDGLAGDINPEQREYLEIALRNIVQLRTMVADLLDVTRARTGRLTVTPAPLPLKNLLAEAVETVRVASKKQARLSVVAPDDLPLAYADTDRVRQVVINLVNNAVRFTPESGTVTVEAKLYDPEHLLIAVADNGCGMGAHDKEQVFDYLYQGQNNTENSRGGLGLGLYIAKELVVRQGGRIWVESEVGKGSTFYFTLPVYKGEGTK